MRDFAFRAGNSFRNFKFSMVLGKGQSALKTEIDTVCSQLVALDQSVARPLVLVMTLVSAAPTSPSERATPTAAEADSTTDARR
jgi:hypothetical protein